MAVEVSSFLTLCITQKIILYVTVQVEKIYSAEFFRRVLLIYMHERQGGSTNERQRVSSLGVSACKLIAQARNILHHKFSPKVLYKVELHIQVICSKFRTYKQPLGLTRSQQPLWPSGLLIQGSPVQIHLLA